MMAFLTYWYLQSPARFYRAFLGATTTVENQMGVQDMIRNISKPLFQDYTFQGRLIGLGLRIVRILAGVILFTLTFIIYILLFLLWNLFPILCLVSLVGSFIGKPA